MTLMDAPVSYKADYLYIIDSYLVQKYTLPELVLLTVTSLMPASGIIRLTEVLSLPDLTNLLFHLFHQVSQFWNAQHLTDCDYSLF